MAKKAVSSDMGNKTKKGKHKMITTIGLSKFSRPSKKKCNQKRGVKKYRGQGR